MGLSNLNLIMHPKACKLLRDMKFILRPPPRFCGLICIIIALDTEYDKQNYCMSYPEEIRDDMVRQHLGEHVGKWMRWLKMK